MAANRERVLAWLADLGGGLITDAIDLDDFTDRLDVAASLSGSELASASLDLVRTVAENVDVEADLSLFAMPAELDDATVLAFTVLRAVALAIAGPRIDWPSRPAARGARALVAEAAESAMAVASSLGANGAELFAWLSSLTAVSIRLLSDIAANAVPVVRVETNLSMPSTVLAYRLYGDASRAGAVVDLARSLTPMLMPSSFDALGS